MQNGSSVRIRTHCIHVFACFGIDLHAQSVLINQISASELRRKFTKSALLVGLLKEAATTDGKKKKKKKKKNRVLLPANQPKTPDYLWRRSMQKFVPPPTDTQLSI